MRRIDDFVKRSATVFRFILRHCGVLKCTPHSSVLARLVSELFTKPSDIFLFFLTLMPNARCLSIP
jgi:hypothetical protein